VVKPSASWLRPWGSLRAARKRSYLCCVDDLTRTQPTAGDDLGLYGEAVDPRERARLLDEGLERLSGFWNGVFRPHSGTRPRIPVWVAATWPNRNPVRRAARWDGLFPIDLPGPEQLAEVVEALQQERAGGEAPWRLEIRGVIEAGP
jgi:alkanesulfonate monooxygenase SsuD/methylene tetrahydromethanopterin reductase-like flavin-dependent oxidoreductase (luciferase family)